MQVKKIGEESERQNSFERIYAVVRQIPKGKVATYGQIARLCGMPRGARTVGWALHANPDPEGTPCFRVVNRFGQVAEAFAFGGGERQEVLLERDGIPAPGGVVDLSKYQWDGRSAEKEGLSLYDAQRLLEEEK